MKISKLFVTAASSLGLTIGAGGYAAAQSYALMQSKPDIYVVMFRADWCPPCKVVEPRLAEALQGLQDPRIEFVNIDISGGYADWNANAVFDRGIVDQYNMWLGVTGFAAIIDGDTKKTLGCVNMSYDTQSMATHIRNLQAQARRNVDSFDLTCPEPNNPV